MDPRVGGGRGEGLSELSFMADSKPQPPKETLPRRSMEPVSNPSRSQTRKLQLPHTLLKPSAPSSDASGDQESRLEANLGGGEFGNSRVKERVDSEAGSESASGGRQSGNGRNSESGGGGSWKEKRGVGPRARVPFHIASIPRPQDQFGILVNNSNQPFQHVWLERSEDGTGLVHPLEKLSVLDFVDKKFGEVEPTKPLPVESAPFKLVEGVKELKELASKLRDVHEFAVDLEHNQYRSFQGLTCLMQISTRTEDFVIDTLKLRVHVGPYLREVFKDPSKRKVMHGADRDILWLQRDFGIYVCNLFDTGQASRLMKLERNSLEYLLHHFCSINANKEYQNADWRLRPIPDEMLKYAREDTHYLLYIYDLMRRQLVSKPLDENGGDLLIEVYRRSYDTCIQLYQKELLTDASYLSIYGLQEADFNSQQLAIVAGLYEWRDHTARAEDESTGYILPNRALLEIAKQMLVSSIKLRHLVKSKHPFVERHLDSVIAIIRRSIQNSAAFENVSEQLKKRRQEAAHGQNVETAEHDCESLAAADYPVESQAAQRNIYNGVSMARTMQNRESIAASISARNDYTVPANTEHFSHQVPSLGKFWQREKFQPTSLSPYRVSKTVETPNRETTKTGNISSLRSAKTLSVVSVEMLDEPTCDLEASLGNKSSRFNSIVGFTMEQHQTEGDIEQMKSLGTRPYYPFSCGDGHLEPSFEENIRRQCLETEFQYFNQPTGATAVQVVPWENESDNSQSSMGRPALELFNQNQIQQRASYQVQIYPPVSKIFPDQ